MANEKTFRYRAIVIHPSGAIGFVVLWIILTPENAVAVNGVVLALSCVGNEVVLSIER